MSQRKEEQMPAAIELPPVVKDAIAKPKKANREKELPTPQCATPAGAGGGSGDGFTIHVPLGEFPEGFLSNHVEARLSSDKQRRNLRRMLVGLRASGAKLENGHFVNTQADLIKWLLEQA